MFERQTVPSLSSNEDQVIEVIEELEKVTIKGKMASLGRGESSAQRVLGNNPLHHELLQIAWPSRLFFLSLTVDGPQRVVVQLGSR